MRLAVTLALIVVAVGPSFALAQDDATNQPVTVSPAEGNWACIALLDNTRAGLLTIFAGSYGYASSNFGSSASGTGTAQMGSDGIAFVDGNLTTVGIKKGLVTFDENGQDVLTLYNPDKAVLRCLPR
ncbi:MAG: hypothetical protein ABI697_12800 [Devosia sp.]